MGGLLLYVSRRNDRSGITNTNYMAMRKIIAICAAVLLLAGCKSVQQTVEVPVYIHDTAYTVKVQHDSTYIDRWHTIEVKGDTVYVRDSHMSVTYRTITDTAYKYIEKPVTVTVEQIKEVAKPLSWWERTQRGGFWVLLAVFSMWLLWKFRKVIL